MAASIQTDTRLKGRIALVTGASSGIGRATARRFAASGARIVCADLNQGPEPTIETELKKTYGDDCAIFVQVNVTNEEQVREAVQKTVAWGGRLDIMCNIAGISIEATRETALRIHETSADDFDKTTAVNVKGVWLGCKHAAAQMLQQEPLPPNARGDRTRGWIINAASILGLVGVAGATCYVTSKHAVVGLTRQMAIDYSADRIHVNAVCPGYVDSPMTASFLSDEQLRKDIASYHPWNALGRPEDIADAFMFLASDEAKWVSGHTLVVDGAYTCR